MLVKWVFRPIGAIYSQIWVFIGRHRVASAAIGALLLGMALGTLMLALISAGDVYDYQDTVDGTHLPEVDAIVCLAGGRGRIAAAADIWYRYWEMAQIPPKEREVPILYMSGTGPKANWNTIVRQFRPGVLQVIKPSDIILEKNSANTEENALWFARYAEEYGWKRVLLVTSRYHMRRARFIFDSFLKFQKLPVGVETMSVYQEPFEPGEWHSGVHGVRVTVIEYLKWAYYKSVWRP
jgi:uncharacterized SAM-binding protein YcdF (DUF218 family)